MASAAPHRGSARTHVAPDGSAALVSQGSSLGRAAPGRGLTREVVVVSDARVDNKEELRTALRRGGHLRAGSPTNDDLIAAAYAAWGDGCAERIVGDFAFALWDSRRRRLIAARDPLAMRSLFFRLEPRRLLLATEVKQILAVPGVPAQIFEPAVAADLVADFGHPGWSFYEGIEQLPPGHTLTVDPAGRALRRFWSVDPDHRVDCRGPQECAEEVRRVFTEAVACRLDPDRPTGVLLSGGVDSGSVASAAGWLAERADAASTPSLHAFSWAFTELQQCDERHISRLITQRYEFEVCDVPADHAGPLACYPEHLPDRDDPFLGAFQPLIEHSLMAARDRGVAVLLGGDRGDLVFGDTGVSYLSLLQRRQLRALKGEVLEHRSALGDPWVLMVRRHLLAAVAGRLRRRTAREWAGWTAERVGRRQAEEASHPPWVRTSLLRRLAEQRSADPGSADSSQLTVARQARYDAILTPLHLRGMAWSERTYARYGLAFADPFSDRRLVELAVALPQAVINRPGDQTKPLMRAAMAGVMPDSVRQQADKILPSPLYARGLRESASLVRQLLAAPQLEARGWVDAAAMREHYEQWLNGGRLRSEFWWTLQVELWLRTHWS